MIKIDERTTSALKAEFIKAGFTATQASEAVDIARHAASEALGVIIRVSSSASNPTIGSNASILALGILENVRLQAQQKVDQAVAAGTLSVHIVER